MKSKVKPCRKRRLQLSRKAKAKQLIADNRKLKKTKPGAIHTQRYPDKGTRRLLRALTAEQRDQLARKTR